MQLFPWYHFNFFRQKATCQFFNFWIKIAVISRKIFARLENQTSGSVRFHAHFKVLEFLYLKKSYIRFEIYFFFFFIRKIKILNSECFDQLLRHGTADLAGLAHRLSAFMSVELSLYQSWGGDQPNQPYCSVKARVLTVERLSVAFACRSER